MKLPHGLYYVPRDGSPAILLGQIQELPINEEERRILRSMLDAAFLAVGSCGASLGVAGPVSIDLLAGTVGFYYVDHVTGATVDPPAAAVGVYYVDHATGATWALNVADRPALVDPERSIARGLVKHAEDALRQTV